MLGSGCVVRAGIAELLDGDATEGGCGGRGVGNGALVLGVGAAVGREGNLECGSGDGRAGDLGNDSAGGSSEMDDRLPTLLLKPDCGEEGVGEPGKQIIGGLVEMRILISGERNISRIASLQSVNSNPFEQVVGVAAVVSDGLLRIDEGDDGEV